jgi:hypothetical protein
MCSTQPKLPVFGSHLKGEMPANAIVLGASHSRLRKGPPKRPHETVAVNFHVWTSVDVQTPIFIGVSGVSRASVDVGGSA